MAVEIKRRGEIDGVEQLTRYLELLNRDASIAPVSGVFAAQQIKPQARTLATDRGIRCLILTMTSCRAWRAPSSGCSSRPDIAGSGLWRAGRVGAADGHRPGRRGARSDGLAHRLLPRRGD